MHWGYLATRVNLTDFGVSQLPKVQESEIDNTDWKLNEKSAPFTGFVELKIGQFWG